MRRLWAIACLVGAGCHTHSGESSVGDAGRFSIDAGAKPVVDGGATPVADAGEVTVIDAGPAAFDAGSVDAGIDAGTSCDVPIGPSFSCPSCATDTPGDIVDVSQLNVPSVPTPDFSPATATSRVLLFSDSPETPTSSGVLAMGNLPAGPARIFLYHVNGETSGDLKFTVVFANAGSSTLVAQIDRYAIGTPSTDYVAEGKAVAVAFLGADNPATKSAAAGSASLLLTSLDSLSVPPQSLGHAIIDVTFSGPAQVWIIALDPSTDTLSAYSTLPDLTPDSHDRGTFDGADQSIGTSCSLNSVSGVTALSLGAPTAITPVVTGTDDLTGNPATLHGDYGVVYSVELPLDATTAEAVLVNPRGGVYGGAALSGSAVVELPSTQTAIDSDQQAGLLGQFAAGQTIQFQWMAPGGSSLPVDAVFIPIP